MQTTETIVTARGVDTAEVAMLAGDYHSGPLTLVIPLGICGVIGFLWFLVASVRALYHNFRYGDPQLQRINTLLLSYFAAHIIFFFFVFGSFYNDLMMFTGLIGLSISVNGGVRGPATAVATSLGSEPLPLARAMS
jgi:hypothetical protein